MDKKIMLNRKVKLIATILGLAGIGFGLALRAPQGAIIGAIILVLTWLFQ